MFVQRISMLLFRHWVTGHSNNVCTTNIYTYLLYKHNVSVKYPLLNLTVMFKNVNVSQNLKPSSYNNTGSCTGRCGQIPDSTQPCQCNSKCSKFGDCCSDYASLCNDIDNTDTIFSNFITKKIFSFCFQTTWKECLFNMRHWDFEFQLLLS